MERIKKEFIEVVSSAYEDTLSNSTLKVVDKYLDWDLLYFRFIRVVEFLKSRSLVRGIDFGCGTGGLVVLGKLCGLDIVGIDAEWDKNPNMPMLHRLKEGGYSIHIFDTSKYPWDFPCDSFEFVASFNSLNEDYTSNSVSNHLAWDGPRMHKRLNEIKRILKAGSIWYVGDKKKYAQFRRSKMWASLEKNGFSEESWSGSAMLGTNKPCKRQGDYNAFL